MQAHCVPVRRLTTAKTILESPIRRSADSRQYALKVVTIGTKEELKFLEQAKHEFRVAGLLDHERSLR